MINLQMYHYAGNNPIKYTDPDGKFLINNIAQRTKNALGFARNIDPKSSTFRSVFDQQIAFPYTFHSSDHPSMSHPGMVGFLPQAGIEIPMQDRISAAVHVRNSEAPLNPRIMASAKKMNNGIFEIQVTVSGDGQRSRTATMAFAGAAEIMTDGIVDNSKVRAIANDAINIALKQSRSLQNLD